MESWRVVSVSELYEVSSLGRIRRNGRLLKPVPSTGGYLRVCLRFATGGQKSFYMHRLVASAFVEGMSGLKNQVNHKDGNVENNASENLEWVTCSENHLHAYQILGRKHPSAKRKVQ